MTANEITVDDLRDDAETRLDFLIESDVIDVDEDDTVTATAAFEDVRGIYADTYGNADDEQFAETIADLFGVSVEEARTRIEETDLTREDLVTYLSLQSHIERDLPQDVLVLLTSMVSGVGYESAVPDSTYELDDDTYAEFIDEHGDVVVIVWSYPCDPCRELKEELPLLEETLPESVTLAGVDGDSVGRFRNEFDVTSAPTTLIFADGELVEKVEGYKPVELLREPLGNAYEGVELPED